MKKLKMLMSINQLLLYLLGMLIFTFMSCEDKDKEKNSSHDPNKPIELEDFSPISGNIRKPVVLRGENFGNDPEAIKVYFNNHLAHVVTAKNDRMFVITPKCTNEDSCLITIVIGEKTKIYPVKYRYNTISSVSTVVGGSKTAEQPLKETTTLALAQFNRDVQGICIDKYDNIFLANIGYLYKINEKDNTVKLLKDVDGAWLSHISTVTTDSQKEYIYSGLTMSPTNFFIFDPFNEYKDIRRDVNFGSAKIGDAAYKLGMAASTKDGYIYVSVVTTSLFYKFNPSTFKATILAQGSSFPFTGDCWGLAFHPLHPELLYMSSNNSHCIYIYNIETNQYSIAAGQVGNGGYWNAAATKSLFNTPTGIAFDSRGDLYIADKGNNCIRKLDYITNEVSLVAGNPEASGYLDGKAEESLFDSPIGIAVNSEDAIYISDERIELSDVWQLNNINKLLILIQ